MAHITLQSITKESDFHTVEAYKRMRIMIIRTLYIFQK
jgi:hypothetical protein